MFDHSEFLTSNPLIHVSLSDLINVLILILVHGSHLEQRIFEGTKLLGRYQVQASRYMAQAIVFVIINAMINND